MAETPEQLARQQIDLQLAACVRVVQDYKAVDFSAVGLTGTLPFFYESTGVETFFRDDRDPAPRSRRVFTFHRPETLAEWAAEPDTLFSRLKAMPTAHPLATGGMRECQIEAITGLEEALPALLEELNTTLAA